MIIDRINKLCKLLSDQQLDALFVSGESNVRYLSGYTNHEAYLFIDANGTAGDDSGRRLLTDFRYAEQAQDECPDFPVEAVQMGQGGIFQVLSTVCAERGIKKLGFEPDFLSVAQFSQLQKAVTGPQLIAAPGLPERLRYVKDAAEEALLRRACAATDRVFGKICSFIRPGLTEKQLEWQMLTLINEEGCENSFPIIAISGEKTSLPHGAPGSRVLQKGDFVTMDFGCMYGGYHADMTRTVLLGQPDPKQKEIYDLVKEAQRLGAAALRAGVSTQEPDRCARDFLTANGYGSYFGHSAGHGVGLDIHEAPSLGRISDRALEAGCFVTMEPGIYMPGWGGVRIEDTLKVTETGSESLFTSTKELICID